MPSRGQKGKAPATRRNATQSTREDGPLFFHMANAAYGEFCQWYPSTFSVSKKEMSELLGHAVDPDDPKGWGEIYFKCAEQYMMYCKAGRFHDTATQAAVMATNDPKEQKRLGRLTKGFDADSWDQVKFGVVRAGNIAKFGQNPHLRRLLLDTGNRVLAEAASADPIWGIGMNARTATIVDNPQRWGQNLLGKALMEARTHLRESGGE